ncbi:MAG TPA: protease complex subunit PrcB family protein [Pyrinomonadaceae bacterium]
MSNFKPDLLTILISCGLSVAGVPTCAEAAKAATQSNNAANNQAAQQSGSAEIVRESPRGRQGGMKVLAEGSYGQVSDPFIAVTRDAQVYAALRQWVKELPPLADSFFKSHAVVAVFTGLHNTGGYGIEMTRSGRGQLLVSESVPPPDMMTTQALTKPFKVVAVTAKEDETVSVVLQGALAAAVLRPYRVASGEFTPDAGGAARAKTSGLEGELKVARYEGLATVFFDLRGVGAKGSNFLQTSATAVVGYDGLFSLTSLEANTLAGRASRRLRVTGRFTGVDEDKLDLDFALPSSKVAEGLSRVGKLAAVATAPAPPKRQPGASMY